MGQQGGLVPWDTRGTAWDSGTPPPTPITPDTITAAMNERPSMKLNPESTASATTNAAQATARPDLYGGTYWGNSTLARDAEISPAIVANRNRFAEEWRLKSRSHADIPHPWTAGTPYDYDHAEQYRDADGFFVLACSNYGDIPPPPVLGMRKIPPIYREDATSYAGRFATLRELRARLEAAEGGGPKFGAARHLFAEPPTPRRSARGSRGKATA